MATADEQATADTAELLALIDRLEGLLQSSQLSEIEVESNGLWRKTTN